MSVIIPDYKVDAQFNKYGGKSSGLFLLKQNGFRVPGFFLIGYKTLQSFLEDENQIALAVDNWRNEHSVSDNTLWAVRSSADVEDGNSESYAGLFHTETNVGGDKISLAVLKLVQAYKEISSIKYGNQPAMEFSIIIQEMINSEISGVVFSRNPITQSKQEILINLIPGLGENLVSGKQEGLRGTCRRNKFNWEKPENNYFGQNYNVQLKDVTLSGFQIIDKIKPFLPELIKGTQKLEKLKNGPVDIELAISAGKLYWLQVRNITTLGSEQKVYTYDNSNIGENYPGTSLPLTISFVRYTYFEAYSRMAVFFGMSSKTISKNKHLFANMVGGIYGALYYNITAWQQLLYQLPFGKRTGKLLPKLLGMEPAEFSKTTIRSGVLNYIVLLKNITVAFLFLKKHNQNYEKVCNWALEEYKPKNFESKSHTELTELYKGLEEKLTKNWLAPLLNGFFAMLFFSLLRKTFLKSRLQNSYPNFINDILYSQGDIVSVQIVREYQSIILEIRDNPELKLFFENNPAGIIQENLFSAFPSFAQRVTLYLEKYGARCDEGELKMETINYSEDPLKFIALIKSGISNYPLTENKLFQFDFREILAKNYKYNPVKRVSLLLLIRLTLPLIRNRENYRFTRTRIFALIRSIFRSIDKSLLQQGKIEKPGDSLWLEIEEILNPSISDNFAAIIQRRKELYSEYQKIERSNRYEKRGETLIPVISKKIVGPSEKHKGIGCCSGIVINRVKIVTAENVCTENFYGYILVAEYFEPGWINIFSQAAGIISARGNLLSHTAILCREMGIPSIIGAKGILKIVKDNDWIKMNGSTGEIIIERNGE